VTERGFAVLPHTADRILEAWAPTFEGCLEEAVAAFGASFAVPRDGAPLREQPVALAVGDAVDELVALLEEAVYVCDALGVVPFSVRLERTEDGLAGAFGVAAVDDVEVVAALPKAVALHEIAMQEQAGGGWRCHVVIDV
jgi:protein archease